jgi:hypothetical protein
MLRAEYFHVLQLVFAKQAANRRENAAALCPAIRRVCGKFCQQPSMESAKAMIRNSGHAVM